MSRRGQRMTKRMIEEREEMLREQTNMWMYDEEEEDRRREEEENKMYEERMRIEEEKMRIEQNRRRRRVETAKPKKNEDEEWEEPVRFEPEEQVEIETEEEEKGLKLKRWVFTIHNYNKEIIQNLKDLPCEFMVFGFELTKRGIPHIQGYVRLKNGRVMKGLKKDIMAGVPRKPDGSRISPYLAGAKGNDQQNLDYCTKSESKDPNAPEDVYIYGTVARPGQRNDFARAKELMIEGGMRAVIEQCNYQVAKHMELSLKYGEGRNWKTNIRWVYGEKWMVVRDMMDSNNAYDKDLSDGNKWWDGYWGQPIVMATVEDPKDLTLMMLRKWAGYTPRRVEVKGGSCQFLAREMIIFSWESPLVLYKDRGYEVFIDSLLDSDTGEQIEFDQTQRFSKEHEIKSGLWGLRRDMKR